MAKNFVVTHKDGCAERITVDVGIEFSTVTRSMRPKNERAFRFVESVAIPNEVLAGVCFALGATEWNR